MKKKWMKKVIALLVIACVAAITAGQIIQPKQRYDFAHLNIEEPFEEGIEFKALGTNPLVKGMVIAAENETLALLVNEDTTEIAVLDKRNNKVWYSNPQDREEDPIANALAKNDLNSQLAVKYFDSNRLEQVYYNFSESIERGQAEIQSIKNGIRITYTLGNLELGADALPKYITPERLQEKVLDKADEKAVKEIKRWYIESKTKEGFLELLEASKKSKITVNIMLKAFEAAGYTEEDLAYDNEMSGNEMVVERQYFVIPLEYRLDGDKLKVTIPMDQVKESAGVKLASLEVLKYFGSGGADENGYIVVPSGSGGIIYFNNGKTKEDPYAQPVYGTDTVLLKSIQPQVTETARLPIYGISKGDHGFLAYIEQGDTVAEINADISGKTNSYNIAYPEFTLRSKDQLYMSGVSGTETDMTIIENNFFNNDLKITYCFLTEENADYSGMANYYGNDLAEKGILKPLETQSSTPFYLDLIGAVEKQQYIVGIPYDGLEAVTTFEQAEKILDLLQEKGINNIQLRYLGWFNGGINHDVAKNVKLERALGSKKQLRELQERLLKMGGNLYPDVAFQLVYYDSKNYSESKEASRYLDGFSGFIVNQNRALLRMGSNYKADAYNINSPAALPSQIKKFIKDYNKLGLSNISLRDLGDILSSDKNKKDPVNRDEAKWIVQEQIGKLADQYDKILMAGGNLYALGYADHLIDMPDTGNKFFIVDEDIPFYQMVVHGYIDYAGDALNIKEGYEQKTQLLTMLEYGMAPHYIWTYDPTSELNQTAYEEYYSTYYGQWINEAVENYNVLNSVFADTRGAKMKKHIIHENGVRQVIYDNGATIYLNYNDVPKNVDGITIEAKGYVYKGEEK